MARHVPIPFVAARALAVWSVILITAPGRADDPGGWQAAAARASITPQEPVWLAGYAARTGPAEGVLGDLHARGLALVDGDGNRLVVVSLEIIEIPAPLRDRITTLAAERHGLAPHELLVNVSHTHGGPMVSSRTVAEWGLDPIWGPRADAYVDFLLTRIDDVIGTALRTLAPATVGHATTRCGFAMNRRLPTSGGVRMAPNPDGSVDHDVPVLRVSRPDGRLVAVVFGYACHATSLGPTPEVHGDYPGFAQRLLEDEHDGAVALFLAGCGGDQDPDPRRGIDDTRAQAAALAAAVDDGLAAAVVPLPPSLRSRATICPLAFAPLPSRRELEALAASPDGFVSRHARWVLETWPDPGAVPPDHPLPVQAMLLGDSLLLVTLGGEPVVEYGLLLKRELAAAGRSVWVAGYSNFVHAYLPTRRVLTEGGYEGTQAVIYQSLPGPFRDDVEDRVMTTVRRETSALLGEAARP